MAITIVIATRAFLLVLLVGCTQKTPSWENQSVAGYRRERFVSEDLYRGISVEVCDQEGLSQVYLSVTTLTFPTSQVRMTHEGTTCTLLGKVFEGGQKLLLDPQSTQIFLAALETSPVTLNIGRFEQTTPSKSE